MAKRRRVNLKFLGILGAALVAAVLVVVVVPMVLVRQDPKSLIKSGDSSVKQGDYTMAVRFYSRAAVLEPKNVDLLVKLGSAYHELAKHDPNFENKDREVWSKCLAVDPSYTPAMQKLLGYWKEVIETDLTPPIAAFTEMYKYSSRLLQINPKDLHAEAYQHISIIAGWLHGIETPEDSVNTSINVLISLMRKDSSNPDVPYYIAQAFMRQAQEFRRLMTADSREQAIAKVSEAVTVFDNAVRAQPSSPVLYLRFYEILSQADAMSQDQEDAAAPARFIPKMREALEKAKQCVKPEDPAFSDVYIYYAQFLARHEEKDAAEKLLRELLKEREKDQQARLVLARFLDEDDAKRPEAIELLQRPIEDAGMWKNGVQRDLGQLAWNTYYALTTYLIKEHEAVSDPAKRAAIEKQIEDSYQLMEDKRRTLRITDQYNAQLESVSLKLRGKIKLLSHTSEAADEAIQILEKARELLVSMDPNRKDWDLTYLLARAYFASRQTGMAESMLKQVCEGVPQFVPARLQLTQLLINKGAGQEALEQLAILDQIAPDEPDVWKLKLNCYAMLNKDIYRPLINHELERIPEETFGDKVAKAHACVILGYVPKAIELLDKAHKEKPSDYDVVQQLVSLYVSLKNKPKALDVVTSGLEADPSNNAFKLMKMELAGEKEEKIADEAVRDLQEIKDPLDREMRLVHFYNDQGKRDQAISHLEAAEKIKPDDVRVLAFRFEVDLTSRATWEHAQAIATKLADLNADHASGMIYRFRLAMIRQDFESAMAISRQLIRDQAEFARSWLTYGQALQAQAQYDQAIENYRIALQKQNENIDAQRGIIDCYYKLNRPLDAKNAILAAIKTQPNVEYFHEQLVLWELNYGDPERAIPERIATKDLRPESLDAWLNLGAAYFQAATVAFKNSTTAKDAAEAQTLAQKSKERVEQARTTFQDAIKKWPDEKLLYAWLEDLAVFTKDFKAGETALLELSHHKAYEKKPDILMMLAAYYERFGKSSEALDSYKAALQVDPTNADLQSKLAGYYTAQKKFDDALNVLGPSPVKHELQVQRVETLIRASRIEEAQAALNRLVKDNPKDAQFLTMLGFVMLNGNKLPQAMEALNQAVEADPQNFVALYWRGYCRLHQVPPELDEAIKDLTMARTLKPDDVQARMLLSEAQHAKNNDEDAIREMETAVQLLPGNKDLRMKLIELYANSKPPRWNDAERTLRVALQGETSKKDPDWKRTEARMWILRKDYQKAVEAIDAAVNLAPKDHTLLNDYLTIVGQAGKFELLKQRCDMLLNDPTQTWATEGWEVYCSRATARFKTGDKDGALNDFDVAIHNAQGKQNEDAVAFVIQSISDTVGIDQAIRRVLDKANQDAHWRVILAALYWRKNDGANAAASIEAVLKDKDKLKNSAELDIVQSLAGNIFMNTGEYVRAEEVYLELVKRNPADLAANNNLACLFANLINPPDLARAQNYSQTAYQTMTQMGMKVASVMDTYGWIQCLAGHPEEGISTLLDAQAKAPLADIYYHLGEAYLMLQQPQLNAAEDELKRAKDVIATMQKGNQFVDVGLPEKVDRALAKVNQMQAAKPGN